MNATLVVTLMLGRKANKCTLKTNIMQITMKPFHIRKTSPHQSPVTT